MTYLLWLHYADPVDCGPARTWHICEGCGAPKPDARVVEGSDCYWCRECRP